MAEIDEAVLERLTKRVESLARQVADLSEWKAAHQGIDVGVAGVGYPHPYQKVVVAEFGSGMMRLDRIGIQLITADGTSSKGIRWLENFRNTDETSPPIVVALGTIDTDYSQLELNASGASGPTRSAGITIYSRRTATAPNQSYISIGGNHDGVSSNLGSRATPDGAYSFTSDPFLLGQVSADPAAAIIDDGMIWYRTDTDEIRVRVNGVTVKLVTAAV